MAVRNIIKMGDPILTKVCKPIENFDQKLAMLLDDLKDTLAIAEGYGLAAPQVGLLKRVCIVDYEGQYFEVINPVLVGSSGSCEDTEGCLSVTGFSGTVCRPEKIEIEFFDRNGAKQTLSAEGYFARVFLHEMDHLDGILFTDKMTKKITD